MEIKRNPSNAITKQNPSNAEKYLGRSSSVADNIKNYEYRKEQILMAEAVNESICSKRHLLIEAGCGVGKSFAYLVPFILWASKKKNRRVAVSTYTKTLQQQLIEKDIPLLKNALDVDFSAALCVGSENYLCLKRLNSIWQGQMIDTPEETETLKQIHKWASKTSSGLKLQIDFNISEKLWGDISRNADICQQKKCFYFNRCFFYKSKKEQRRASILVLNHHLILNDMASGGNIIPRYEAVVFDEAQNLENVASDTLGLNISLFGVQQLLSRIYKSNSARCLLNRFKKISKTAAKDIKDTVHHLRQQADDFFAQVLDEFGINNISHRLNVPEMFDNNLSEPLIELSDLLMEASDDFEEDEEKIEFKSCSRRCSTAAKTLQNILSLEFEDYVYFVEIKTTHHRIYCSFNAIPINVSKLMNEIVFKQISTIVMTSATLTVNNSFDFIKNRLGISSPLEVHLNSPFNYKKNVLLYCPSDLPDPSYEYDKFKEEVADRITEILQITKGRTFILFTSYSMLNSIAENLTKSFSDLNFLIHGQMPQKMMLKEFAEKPNSILLGTATFWQGVDFPGRLLECVILTKLPFASPNDPVTDARIESIRKKAGDPFLSYQIPVAALTFKQGFGRLIRHRNDYGIIAILDPRVKTRKYGKFFLNSLPECNEVFNLKELASKYAFLQNHIP